MTEVVPLSATGRDAQNMCLEAAEACPDVCAIVYLKDGVVHTCVSESNSALMTIGMLQSALFTYQTQWEQNN